MSIGSYVTSARLGSVVSAQEALWRTGLASSVPALRDELSGTAALGADGRIDLQFLYGESGVPVAVPAITFLGEFSGL